MLSFIITLPSLALVFLWALYSTDTVKSALFDLNTNLVRKVFVPAVYINMVIWLVSLVLPIAFISNLSMIACSVIGIVWFVQALFNGKAEIWFELLKSKFQK